MLDGQLQDARRQVENLERAKHRPQVLDAETTRRLQAVFSDQLDLLPVFREQIVRWSDLPLDEHLRMEINRLNAVLDQLKVAIKRILLLDESRA
jgi:hypothetical protein